jgi:hypothetical protein
MLPVSHLPTLRAGSQGSRKDGRETELPPYGPLSAKKLSEGNLGIQKHETTVDDERNETTTPNLTYRLLRGTSLKKHPRAGLRCVL